MRHPIWYLSLQTFSLVASLPPRVYQRREDNTTATVLRHVFAADVEPGDMVKHAPGTVSVYRRGMMIAQHHVTDLAVRSFRRLQWITPI